MATKITPRHAGGNGRRAPAAFDSLNGLPDEMNHLFDEFFTGFGRRAPSLFRAHEPGWLLGGRRGGLTPAVDIA